MDKPCPICRLLLGERSLSKISRGDLCISCGEDHVIEGELMMLQVGSSCRFFCGIVMPLLILVFITASITKPSMFSWWGSVGPIISFSMAFWSYHKFVRPRISKAGLDQVSEKIFMRKLSN